ncbi:GTP-binding protein, putative [Candida dubliniensis CD36]|uniref:GTP-binding protein, putative n=1 Tax=Candida dubliniensis (strain CD36 / ATCC MYA-646 / CBS 7987 / NCPF 3949 / NRRL Y-17841) TaxID=573826 RepID=B9W724_CANDC|nr:GTP-binding protein, putative [Candida dubliniensis CD36]CAX44482.1 GTP-binding protein, putative [Candida dubliniensis CD36]
MGLLTIIKKQKLKDNEIRILTLGLDNSGKTTIIKKMLNQDITTISPTMGFQINTLIYNNQYTLNIWDIGGQTSLRLFWGNYFDKTNVVIWVIDGLSLERLNESYQELKQKIILQDRLIGIYLMIIINKIDLIISKSDLSNLKEKVIDLLQLNNHISQRNKWQVELVSGKTGQGIDKVLQWIVTREY